MLHHPEFQEEAAMVTILTLGYRARCTERGCDNLARAIFLVGWYLMVPPTVKLSALKVNPGTQIS